MRWGFVILIRYVGHFRIRTSNPNFIGFLWLIYLRAQWVLFLKFFVNFGFWGFLPRFVCHLVLSSFLSIVLVVIFDCQFNVNLTTFVLLILHWDACSILTLDSIFGWVCLFLSFDVLVQPLYLWYSYSWCTHSRGRVHAFAKILWDPNS